MTEIQVFYPVNGECTLLIAVGGTSFLSQLSQRTSTADVRVFFQLTAYVSTIDMSIAVERDRYTSISTSVRANTSAV